MKFIIKSNTTDKNTSNNNNDNNGASVSPKNNKKGTNSEFRKSFGVIYLDLFESENSKINFLMTFEPNTS